MAIPFDDTHVVAVAAGENKLPGSIPGSKLFFPIVY